MLPESKQEDCSPLVGSWPWEAGGLCEEPGVAPRHDLCGGARSDQPCKTSQP